MSGSDYEDASWLYSYNRLGPSGGVFVITSRWSIQCIALELSSKSLSCLDSIPIVDRMMVRAKVDDLSAECYEMIHEIQIGDTKDSMNLHLDSTKTDYDSLEEGCSLLNWAGLR